MFHTRQWARTVDTKWLLPFLPCLCKMSERENQKREMLAVQEGTSAPRELESEGLYEEQLFCTTSSTVTEKSKFKQRLNPVKLLRRPVPSSPGHLI